MPPRSQLRGPGDVAPFHADGRTPTLVALHGFTGTPSELRPVLDRVAAAGWAVRAPLLAGHGTSPADLQTRRFGDWVASAREELDRAAARGPVVLCGFSMGSLVALQLASDAATRASIGGLVLLGCALRLSGPLRAAFVVAERTGVALPDAYVPKPFPPDVRDARARALITHYDRHPMRAAMEVFRAGQRLRERLGDVTCPTVVMHGALDRVCSVEGAREVAERLGSRDVRLHVLARSAHVVAVDHDRDEVAEAVLAMLRRTADAAEAAGAPAQRRPVEP
jgi:carboxylesterase